MLPGRGVSRGSTGCQPSSATPSWEALGESFSIPMPQFPFLTNPKGGRSWNQRDDWMWNMRNRLCHPPTGSATSVRSSDASKLHFSTEGRSASASWSPRPRFGFPLPFLSPTRLPLLPGAGRGEINQNRTCLSFEGRGSVSISPQGARGTGKLQYQHGNYNWRRLIHPGG